MRSRGAWFLVPPLLYTSVGAKSNIDKLITSLLFHRGLVLVVFYNKEQVNLTLPLVVWSVGL